MRQRVFAVMPIAALVAISLCAQDAVDDPHPPIAIPFTLQEPGVVTLVIEDAAGHRVRNLIGETPFPVGKNVVYWDGMDESIIVPGTPNFTYSVQGKFVTPGTYKVRGLVRKPLNLVYEMTVNNPGDPPWECEDGHGAWLADHTPQTSVLALKSSPYSKEPHLLLGSSIAEAGHALAWVNLAGRKLYGCRTAGTQGAYALAADAGHDPRANTYAYVLYHGNNLTITALGDDGVNNVIAQYKTRAEYERADRNHMGLAVFNGVIVASLPPENKLLFINAKQQDEKKAAQAKIIGTADVPSPAGLLYDSTAQQLLVVSGREVHSFKVDWAAGKISDQKIIIPSSAGLENPHKLAMDAEGRLYVSDWGASNQVKVFAKDGKFLSSIGTAGALQVGPYNPLIMTQPNGIAVSADNKLWVAECSYLPKRCSVWSLEGKLLNSFIGPTPYGGGGILDGGDKSRFYFAPHSGTLEFKLDWERGSSELANILFRPDTGRLQILDKDNVNQTPHHAISVDGRRYLTNTYNESDGPRTAGIWTVKDGATRLVAAVGCIRSWSVLDETVTSSGHLRSHLPAGVKMNEITVKDKKIPMFNRADAQGKNERVNLLFAWSDKNFDEKVQPEEVTYNVTGHPAPMWVVGEGLNACDCFGNMLEPRGFTDAGVPLYDATAMKRLVNQKIELTAVTRQPVPARDGWLVITGAPMEGFRNGEKMWYYHSQWPTGMSKGRSPKPQFGGQLLNTLELLGPAVTPKTPDKMEIWGISGDYGNLFLLTTDGLFVGTLFKDSRVATSHYWPTPAKRGMLLNDCTLLAECYYPTMTQSADGNVYLQAGKNRSSIVRVDGLDTIRRIPVFDVAVTTEALAAANAYQLRRQQDMPRTEITPMKVAIIDEAPTVDGKILDWDKAAWCQVDDKTRAAVVVTHDTLYAAFSTSYELTLENRPDSISHIFKGGDALDLMLGTNPSASDKREAPVAGDLRLTVAEVGRKTTAVLFQQVAPGGAPVKYESPVGSVTIDRVEDVSQSVKLAGGVRADPKNNKKTYTWEMSVPLATLGLKPAANTSIRADIGILRGKPGLTGERIYWSNKAAGHTVDLPTEARLTPSLWGTWQFTEN